MKTLIRALGFYLLLLLFTSYCSSFSSPRSPFKVKQCTASLMSIALYALKAALPAFRSGVQKSRRGKNPHRSRPFYCVPNNIILIFSPFREIRPAHIHILGSTFHVIQKKPFLSSDTFHTSPILMIVTICTERLAKIMTFEAKQSRKSCSKSN